jgi:hypothetical protein
MSSNELIKQRSNAMLVCEYLKEYIDFEKNVVKYFLLVKDSVPQEVIQAIFFFHGAKSINNIQYRYTEGEISISKLKYSEEKGLKKLSVANILAINKNRPVSKAFEINISRVEKRSEDLSFYTICNALLKMRNLIAHVISDERDFDKQALVDNLSPNALKANLPDKLKDVSVDHLNIFGVSILSNYIYMDKLHTEIKKRIEKLEKGD